MAQPQPQPQPHPPNLSVMTQAAGPSTLPRRAMGPRRRAGLFVANPDNSDEEGSTPSRTPATASASQRSPVRGSPVTSSSSSSGKGIPILPPPSHESPPSASSHSNLPPIPSVPAPQSSPLPFLTAFPSPQPHPPTPSPSAPLPDYTPAFSPIPPQPPPQPERHLRRAMTTPGPDQPNRPSLEAWNTSGSSFAGPPPQSPTRALPPLPSPPPSKPPNMSPNSASPHNPFVHGPPPSVPPPPQPLSHASATSILQQETSGNRSQLPPHVNRTTSPEDIMSPAGRSDGGKSFASVGSADVGGRPRSGSVPNKNVRLQVTTDNEQFTLVDITGVASPAGIKDRVFSKLRFGDDDYPTLSLYRTEIGEAANTEPLSDEALLQLCNSVGDAKATLKLLVMVTSMPESASATVVPPSELPAAFLTNAAHRAGIPPISTNPLAPTRTPSRHSKDGSMSSASELERPTSEWSEIGAEEAADWQGQGQGQLRRSSRRSVKRSAGRKLGSSTGSSRSLLTDPSLSLGSSSPALPTPPGPSAPQISLRDNSSTSSPLTRTSELDQPTSPWGDDLTRGKGSLTPTPNTANASSSEPSRPAPPPNAAAGPSGSSGSGSGLGLNIDYDGIDDASRALIEQLQREDEEAQQREEARRQQLAADEELAWRHQQEERAVWQRMQSIQLESRRRQQEQIEMDESRARELDAEERRMEDERQRQEAHDAARAAYEAERSDSHDDYARGARFADERRQRAQHFEQLQNRNSSFDSRTLPTIEDRSTTSPFSARRPSDAQFDPVRQYPVTNPIFDQPIFQSPPPQFANEVPSLYNRRPSGFPGSQQDEVNHARERLHDARLRGMEGRTTPTHPGQRAITQPVRRGESRLGYTEQDFRAPPLQNVRSMGNMRATSPAPVSRPPFHGIPARSSITPAQDQRSMPGNGYRSGSVERPQDGRYPEPSQSAPSRVPPLQISSPSGSPLTIIPFPSPNLRASGTWTGYTPTGSPPLAAQTRRPSWERRPSSPRPQTVHYDRSSPQPTSPRTATLLPRPATLYSNTSPPDTARTVGGYANISPPSYYHSRSRSGSATAPFRSTSPYANQPRRASDAGIEDRGDTQLPYAASPEHSWLSVPRSGRRDTDATSIAGTVSSGFSEATLRPRATSVEYEENESEDTVRGGELTRKLADYMDQDDGATLGTLRPNLPLPRADYGEEDGDEVDIFLPGPGLKSESPRPISRAGLRPSPSRPNLSVKTTGFFGEEIAPTTSDSESESVRIQRAKSFARPKDEPEQWHVRPEPEQLYEHLDNFFPKIDLDKPIVDGQISTPSTPAAESPSRAEFPPPPVHPSRQPSQATLSPRQSSPSAELTRPPQHPASRAAAFNKAENRKSIRVMADHKAKSLARESKNFMGIRDVFTLRQEAKKPERRKSSSMWGHKVVEVTPSKLQSGQVPSSIPESPAADGKPPTLNWVKGELIGKGSYGRVYIALNVTTGDMMAVKQVELPSNEVDRNDHRQRGSIEALYVEIELLKDLYHPNIVAYLGCETSPQYISIFLEYVPGGTIASIYRTPNQGRFEEQLVKFFTAQILEGLAYLHDRNIWHRDLKGDNILVDAAGVCKISDFGISKQTEDAYNSFGQATNMKGSVFWMAPEVIHSANERTYSGKIDIWSLGCVVLEMWTGTRPWGVMEQVAAMFELFNKRSRPPLPPDIQLNEVALDFMNEKCLAKDPRDRPTAKELMEHRFIAERDPTWSFATSKIGKAVAKKAPRTMKAM